LVKRKKIYLGFLRDRLRWLASPHDLASVPLADVECYTRRFFVASLALDDIVVVLIAAMCSVSSAGFADEMEVATIDLISAMFFIMVLDEKV
jgi:hypothetical protein